MRITSCMVPEIWGATDRIFQHFGSFFTLLLPNEPQNPSFFKNEKDPGGIIDLHLCTINDNNMMYDSWDMEHNGQNVFSF